MTKATMPGGDFSRVWYEKPILTWTKEFSRTRDFTNICGSQQQKYGYLNSKNHDLWGFFCRFSSNDFSTLVDVLAFFYVLFDLFGIHSYILSGISSDTYFGSPADIIFEIF